MIFLIKIFKPAFLHIPFDLCDKMWAKYNVNDRCELSLFRVDLSLVTTTIITNKTIKRMLSKLSKDVYTKAYTHMKQ